MDPHLRPLFAVLVLLGAGCPDRAHPTSAPPEKPGARPAVKVPASKAPQPARTPRPATRPAVPAGARSWSFAADEVGGAPAGFKVESGTWRVVADDTAAGDGKALAQQASSPGPAFNVVLVQGTSLGDVDLAVRMKSVAGRIDRGGGLVWRAADAKNYYVARFNPLEDNFRVYTVKGGRRRLLKSARLKLAAGRWNTLRITMAGDRIRCYLDGKEHLDLHDATFTGPGKIGLWTKADARTLFDALKVSPYREP